MFKHLLIAVDGSALAESAFDKAIGLASEMNARVTAIRVCPDYHLLAYHTEMLTDTREQYKDAAQAGATRYLTELTRKAAIIGVSCQPLYMVSDHPYDAIIKAAEDRKCDLIVMASHGRRGVQGVLIGSETQKVLTHSTIPVLVYR